MVDINPLTEDGLVGVGGVPLGGSSSIVARGYCSSGRSPIHCWGHAFDLSSGRFQPMMLQLEIAPEDVEEVSIDLLD